MKLPAGYVFLTLAVIYLLSGSIDPRILWSSRERLSPQVRTCLEQQILLNAAIELYERKNDTTVEVMNKAFLATLIEKRYVKDIFKNNGVSHPNGDDYVLLPDDKGLFCLKHGLAEPPSGDYNMAPIDQLYAIGVRQHELLNLTSSVSPSNNSANLLQQFFRLNPVEICAFLFLIYSIGYLGTHWFRMWIVANFLFRAGLIIAIYLKISESPITPGLDLMSFAFMLLNISAARFVWRILSNKDSFDAVSMGMFNLPMIKSMGDDESVLRKSKIAEVKNRDLKIYQTLFIVSTFLLAPQILRGITGDQTELLKNFIPLSVPMLLAGAITGISFFSRLVTEITPPAIARPWTNHLFKGLFVAGILVLALKLALPYHLFGMTVFFVGRYLTLILLIERMLASTTDSGE